MKSSTTDVEAKSIFYTVEGLMLLISSSTA